MRSADRYTATAIGDPPALTSMAVTDRGTGATVQWTAEDPDHVTILQEPVDEHPATVGQFLQHAREIIGLARQVGGRPNERLERIADYRAAVGALRDAGYSESR